MFLFSRYQSGTSEFYCKFFFRLLCSFFPANNDITVCLFNADMPDSQYRMYSRTSFERSQLSLWSWQGRAAYRQCLLSGCNCGDPGFVVHVGFAEDKVALGEAYLRVCDLPCEYHSTITLCVMREIQ